MFLRGKEKGFTLAEILITLGIIGVITAITIPNLISKYNKRQIETQLFAIHSTIMQGVRLAQANTDSNFTLDNLKQDSTNVNGFSWAKSKAVFDEYFAPVFKVSRTYKSYKNPYKIYSYDKAQYIHNIDGSTYLVELINGTVLGFTKAGNQEMFYIDIILKPNKEKLQTGKDYFWIRYKSDGNGNYSPSKYSFSEEQEREYCKAYKGRPAASIFPGAFCTDLILKNNFKIPAKYPIKI